MYISNKLYRVLCSLLGVVVAIALTAGRQTPVSARPTQTVPDGRLLILLDPGHGGIDPGAITKEGLFEKDVNLGLALCLRDILTAAGYRVIMTRTEDISLHTADSTTVAQKKKSDLKARLGLFHQYPNTLTLLLHQNFFSDTSQWGAQMFYGLKNPASKVLAEAIQTAIRREIQPDNKRKIRPSAGDVFLLEQCENPIVLVETGFLSNPTEAAKLTDPDYQQEIAFALFCGIEEYRAGQAQKE